jgi:hypothetical protein
LDGTVQRADEFAWRGGKGREQTRTEEGAWRGCERARVLGATRVRSHEAGEGKQRGVRGRGIAIFVGDRGYESGRAAMESAARVRAEEEAGREPGLLIPCRKLDVEN